MEIQGDSVLLKQGAESRVYTAPFLNHEKVVVKHRFKKSYRLPALDMKITRSRTLSEVKTMVRLMKAGIRVPTVYFVDMKTSCIYMEYFEDSQTMKEAIINASAKKDAVEMHNALAVEIGKVLKLMHAADIIHGDLTTSNILVLHQPGDKRTFTLALIDFGLSSVSRLAEDKAVDLYVLERAFLSTHPNSEKMFKKILEEYGTNFKGAKPVLTKLDEGVHWIKSLEQE
eukprot:Nk52_evm18s370 gene=Nk52_evmTU18s370